MALIFVPDIRSLFRYTPDVDTMQSYRLDLSSDEEGKPRSSLSYAQVVHPALLHMSASRTIVVASAMVTDEMTPLNVA